jgi:hypothetical protein
MWFTKNNEIHFGGIFEPRASNNPTHKASVPYRKRGKGGKWRKVEENGCSRLCFIAIWLNSRAHVFSECISPFTQWPLRCHKSPQTCTFTSPVPVGSIRSDTIFVLCLMRMMPICQISNLVSERDGVPISVRPL